MAGGALAGSSLAKSLASNNKKTRDKALRLFKTWLPSQQQVPNDELNKIWKGLFYCVWHSDKQSFQIELINRLSSLLVSLDPPLSIHYFEAFLITMRREWSGIDFLRLDKFYLLIRRFLHNLFLVLKRGSWDLELCNRMMCVLGGNGVLVVGDDDEKCCGQGVDYHICEVFLEELKPFLPIRLEVFDVVVKPFLTALEKCPDKVLLNKIKTSVFDCLLRDGVKLLEIKKGGDCIDGSVVVDEVEKIGTIALAFGLSGKFFELGSSSSCLQGNRKVLLGLHEDFLKLEKDLANAGVEVPVPEVHEDVVLDNVPDLVPISELGIVDAELLLENVSSTVLNDTTDKPSKKSKKDKKGLGETKKSKKNRNELTEAVVENEDENENESIANEGISTNGVDSDIISEFVISDLQIQFEKVAAEVDTNMNDTNSSDTPDSPVTCSVSKKRKRDSADRIASVSSGQVVVDDSATEMSVEKRAKKVKFAMKSNLVWKPHSPLPPQSLRLPPSATPRGSALKKGVPPGPIIETALVPKKAKKRTAAKKKKARKVPKRVSPKRLRK